VLVHLYIISSYIREVRDIIEMVGQMDACKYSSSEALEQKHRPLSPLMANFYTYVL